MDVLLTGGLILTIANFTMLFYVLREIDKLAKYMATLFEEDCEGYNKEIENAD